MASVTGVDCKNGSALFDRFTMDNYHWIKISGIPGDSMAKNTSVTPVDYFDEFIAHQLQSGRYGLASEVIRAALRMLEKSETRLERPGTCWRKGNKAALQITAILPLLQNWMTETANVFQVIGESKKRP